jgi:hypothetical protein
MQRAATLLSSVFSVLTISSAAMAAPTKFQDFTFDPNWTGVGNTTVNNYGYSAATNHAGGATGEAGGTFVRRATEDYYADVASFTGGGGAFGLNTGLVGSGRFDAFDTSAMDGNVLIGHRSASTSNRSFLGLGVIESNTLPVTNIRLGAFLILNDGTSVAGTAFGNIPNNTDRTFSYVYDPTGGVNSQGRLTLTVSTVGSPFIIDLTAAHRTIGATFDAWGIGGSIVSNTAANGKVFIDDVTYTVPEPTVGLGATLLVLARLKRVRRPAAR